MVTMTLEEKLGKKFVVRSEKSARKYTKDDRGYMNDSPSLLSKAMKMSSCSPGYSGRSRQTK